MTITTQYLVDSSYPRLAINDRTFVLRAGKVYVGDFVFLANKPSVLFEALENIGFSFDQMMDIDEWLKHHSY